MEHVVKDENLSHVLTKDIFLIPCSYNDDAHLLFGILNSYRSSLVKYTNSLYLSTVESEHSVKYS